MRAIGKQETSAGQGACTLEDRQECLSYLNAVAVGAFTRNVRAGGEWGKKRCFLPNKANKSFRISKRFWEEGKKATRKSNQSP